MSCELRAVVFRQYWWEVLTIPSIVSIGNPFVYRVSYLYLVEFCIVQLNPFFLDWQTRLISNYDLSL